MVLTDPDGGVALVECVTGRRAGESFERPMVPGRSIPFRGAFKRVSVSPDGRLAAAGSRDVDLTCIWEATTGRLNRTISGAHPEGVASVAFSTDSTLLLTAGPDGTAKLWRVADAPGAPPRRQFGSQENPVTVAAIDPAVPSGVVTGHSDGRVVRRGLDADGRPIAETLAQVDGGVTALAFAAVGSRLAAGEGKVVHLIDLSGPRPRDTRLTPPHQLWVNVLVAWPGTPVIASAGDDGTILFWDTNEARLLGSFPTDPGPAGRAPPALKARLDRATAPARGR